MILFSLGKQKNHGDKRCKDLSDRDGVPDAVNVKNQRENENRGRLEHERPQKRDRGGNSYLFSLPKGTYRFKEYDCGIFNANNKEGLA